MMLSKTSSVPDQLDILDEDESLGTAGLYLWPRRGGFVSAPSHRIMTQVDQAALNRALTALTPQFPELALASLNGKLPPLLEQMLALHGVKETPGPASNPIIDEWIAELGWQKGLVTSDNSPWCTVPVALSWQRLGYQMPLHAPWSQAWAVAGVPVLLGHETLGDVVVLTRGLASLGKGHVGLALRWEKNWVAVFGGNTGDAMAVGWYRRKFPPIKAVRRWPE